MQQFIERRAIDFDYHADIDEMASLEVELEYQDVSSHAKKPSIRITALVATNSRCSQISTRLAERLGINYLTERPTFVVEAISAINPTQRQEPIPWHITRSPLTVKCCNNSPTNQALDSVQITPVINSTFCFWDVILGQDYDWLVGSDALFSYVFSHVHRPMPSPGPDYQPGLRYKGHNIRFCRSEELPLRQIDAFVEYTHENSTTVERIAVNSHGGSSGSSGGSSGGSSSGSRNGGTGDGFNGKMVVIFRGDATIYYYQNVPLVLADMIRDNYESKGKILSEIKKLKPVGQLETFPETLFVTRLGQRYKYTAFDGHTGSSDSPQKSEKQMTEQVSPRRTLPIPVHHWTTKDMAVRKIGENID